MTPTNESNNKVAIILAAGRGSRLKELSLEQPKPMVTVNNQTIISNLVSHLISAGIDHIVVTIGYKAEKLREHLSVFSNRVKLTFIENPIFDTTNNIYTLWLTKEFLREGFYLFEADVFLEESILVDFLKAPQDDVMLVDKFTPVMNGTVVDFDQHNRVKGMYLKNNQTGDFSFADKFKTVNFYKISRDFSQSFFIDKLDYHIQQKDTGSYYELIIKEAIDGGKIFYAYETGNRRWYEIDTREDLEAAESMFKN